MRFYRFLTSLIVGLCLMTGCENNGVENPVSKVRVSPEYATLAPGKTMELTATVTSASKSSTTALVWESTMPAVATVSAEGIVTAVADGDAIIYAECNGIIGTCLVTVVTIPVESITLDKDEAVINIGESLKLKATVLPENAFDRTITWTSDNTAVATVDENGKVSGLTDGTAVITAKSGDRTATATITVIDPALPKIGHYFYYDGTFSRELDRSKLVAGVIFYVGDPTADDAALKKDHPECSHGLAVSINNGSSHTKWQDAFDMSPVGDWIADNTEYTTITCTSTDELFTKIMGYNNTQGILKYNEKHTQIMYDIKPVGNLATFNAANSLPENTSGWYLPSVKELSLLVSGAKNTTGTATLTIVNNTLSTVDGASKIGNLLWSSSEAKAANVHIVNIGDSQIIESAKINLLDVRYIFAF